VLDVRLVCLGDDPDGRAIDAFTWERYESRKYVHRTAPSAALDLSLVLIGIAARRHGTWLWSEGIYA
jgi:hypothetical protein